MWLVGFLLTHFLLHCPAMKLSPMPDPTNTTGIIAFDCNTTSLDVITFDLNHVQECIAPVNITSSAVPVKVQIIQKKDMDVLMVRRCHVVTQMLMWHCGMHSHSTMANFDFSPIPLRLSPHECEHAHRTGTVTLHGKTVSSLARNHTTIFSTTRVGSVWGEGQCEGGTLDYAGYTYKNVVVKQSYQISLYEKRYYYTTGTEEVTAFNGVTCKLSDLSCHDFEVGTLVWSHPEKECHKNGYESLYAGSGELVKTTKLGPNELYIRVQSTATGKFQIFTPLLRYEPLCGLDGWATPYHGLYVIQYKDRPPFPLTSPIVPNVDFVRYIETKFTTFAFGSALSISSIIQKLSHAQCNAHRETLLNRLHIISATPSSANLLVGNKPGIYGRVAGEVVHILQCPAVQVTLRRAAFCTSEIPVVANGKNLYMDARTRILTDVYTATSCSVLTPVMFRHGTAWVKMSPHFSPAEAPKVITPDTSLDDLNFRTFTSYAMGGIYDPHDLQQLRDFMMFSSRREAMTSNIAAGLEGKQAPKYDITKVLDAAAWETLAKDRLKQMWGKFQGIGEVISGCLGIYFCIVLIKAAIGILIRCFNIYKVTGMSWALIAGIWSALTQLILTIMPGRQARQAVQQNDTEDPEGPEDQPTPSSPTPASSAALYPNVSKPLPDNVARLY